MRKILRKYFREKVDKFLIDSAMNAILLVSPFVCRQMNICFSIRNFLIINYLRLQSLSLSYTKKSYEQTWNMRHKLNANTQNHNAKTPNETKVNDPLASVSHINILSITTFNPSTHTYENIIYICAVSFTREYEWTSSASTLP